MGLTEQLGAPLALPVVYRGSKAESALERARRASLARAHLPVRELAPSSQFLVRQEQQGVLPLGSLLQALLQAQDADWALLVRRDPLVSQLPERRELAAKDRPRGWA